METFPRILSLGTCNPPNRYSQREIYAYAAKHVEMYRSPRVEQIFMSSDIDYRHFAFDLDTLDPDEDADALHERFAEHSVVVGGEAVRRCLADGAWSADDVDCIIAVSCTGYLCPGLSSILVKDLGLRHDVQRADLVGMGCAGALPGLQRAYDFVRAYPGKKALVVTVEICSACYYVDDSLETVVGNAICGDGAAAVMVGDAPEGSGPGIVCFQTLLEPSFLHTVGFQFKSGKLRIVLSKDIRNAAGGLAKQVVDQLLERQGLSKTDIGHWVIHSGGRKVIDSIKDAVGLAEAQLVHSRCVLKNFGNMSSPTVLYVLQETLSHARPRAGEYGLMLAMGPGLAVETALLRW